ncbi:protein SOSEKI 3-like [Rutidosis leptorrhynchoides]|uniref:protein SOSEKI 3-like n=1 Tax=Rutidosis leptorrhynchoides TaxID=125765 RepID=UPI003A9A3613
MEQNRSRKVPVVYYLYRNRQLEHPHFIEVSPVSPDGLYLKDVIEKFDALRGRGMASMYSWSCKRSYKNAFVWNDLGEDDLIIPVHENEYVLKGSELLGLQNNMFSYVCLLAPPRNINLHNMKQLAELHSSITRDCRETKNLNDDDKDACQSLTKYTIYKTNSLVDSSTQTEEYVEVKKTREACTTSVLVDNVDVESITNESRSSCSSLGKTDTLESLMNADGSKLTTSIKWEDAKSENEEEKRQKLSNAKLSASNKLLKLISCGSFSTQDYDFGRTSSCRIRSLDSNFSGALNCLSEDKQYFSGSLVDTKLVNKEDFGSLKRSSSYSTSRSNKCDSVLNRTKCISRSIKGSLIKNSRSTSLRFFEHSNNSCIVSPCPSNNGSNRITVTKQPSNETESSNNDKENVIKIEERLSSGARVIIHFEENNAVNHAH